MALVAAMSLETFRKLVDEQSMLELSPTEMGCLLAIVDKDGSGSIDGNEFMSVWNCCNDAE